MSFKSRFMEDNYEEESKGTYTQNIPEHMLNILNTGNFKTKFTLMGNIGAGAFGSVFKVRNIIDTKIYAIKKVQIHVAPDEDIVKNKALREAQLIADLESSLVIRYYNCWLEEPSMEEIREERMMVEKYKKKKVKRKSNHQVMESI